MSFTLDQIKEKIRERANMENSTFISDSELTGYTNSSYAELYDILVGTFEDYYSRRQTFVITTGNSFEVPADTYKIRGLDFQLTPDTAYTIRKFNFEERNRIDRATNRLMNGLGDRVYRVMGKNLIILPADKGAGTYTLWDIPRFTPLVNGTDVMGDVLDFEEYVIVDAAIKCLLKEESDVQALMIVKDQLKRRIEAMAPNRDTTPDRISDVRSENRLRTFGFGWEF